LYDDGREPVVFFPFRVGRRIKKTPSAEAVNTYDNFADNCAYAVVQVAPVADTYENVIDPSILDGYEPIETPAVVSNFTSAAVDDRVCYENVDNVLEACYKNVGKPMVEAPVEEAEFEEEGSAVYENVDIRNPDNVNVYETTFCRPAGSSRLSSSHIPPVVHSGSHPTAQGRSISAGNSSVVPFIDASHSANAFDLFDTTNIFDAVEPIHSAYQRRCSRQVIAVSATSLNRSPAEQSKANRKSQDKEVPSVKEVANPAAHEVKEPCTQSSSQSSTLYQSHKTLSLSKPPINAVSCFLPVHLFNFYVKF
jgi:hypothetical protein